MSKQALISVFDKKGITTLGKSLSECGFKILSTGGTYSALEKEGITVSQVSDVTGFPEVLEGRVKTLHPNIHAGILANLDSPQHVGDLQKHNIHPIQLVVVNLYPFVQTVSKPNVSLPEAIEMIDIGGVALLRAAAKNFAHVLVVVDPNDYDWISQRIKKNETIPLVERKNLALKAFQHVSTYDTAIANYLADVKIEGSTTASTTTTETVTRVYEPQLKLKYGINPHQAPASIYKIKDHELPFKVLNGTPGYINFLDAFNAWQLVKELKEATGLAAAASFKHVSPAGAAVAVPLTEEEKEVYELKDKILTPQALAYLRARNADPMCSYGDFAALSDVVDEATALILKTEVSDGIIAPGFDPKAIEILKQKKSGGYILIQVDPKYEVPDFEFREVYGVGFGQKRNNAKITQETFNKVVSSNKNLSDVAIRDQLVATITLKYTQSNSVAYAINGQAVGVGAGQQSRVDCAILARSKVKKWYMRFNPKVRALPFKKEVKRVDRINARVHFIDGSLSAADLELFTEPPPPLTEEEKVAWLSKLTGVSLSSDAFFPFRDSIDVASKFGVSFVSHPGGSVQDENVSSACDEYKMVLSLTGIRLFHH